MRRLFSLDTETELIARGRQIPPLVVVSYAELDIRSREPRIVAKGLVHHTEALDFLVPLLDDPQVHITGANIAYDVLVTSALWPNPDPDDPSYREDILARWVAAYDADRVTDLLTRQKLLDLAAGCYRREALADGRWAHHRYNLEALAWRLCRMRLDKGDPRKKPLDADTRLTPQRQARIRAQVAAGTEEADDSEERENSWRLRYAELRDTPIDSWPADAREYALNDAVAGALVYHAQESDRPSVQTASHPLTESVGVNVWSGAEGLAAALTNPTELARRKGNLQQSYPLVYRGKTWPDLEAAWFALSPSAASTTEADRLMADMIRAKLEQHPRLFQAAQRRGGAAWLRKCSHFTDAKSNQMREWEGYGEQSRFIRNLVAGYELRERELGAQQQPPPKPPQPQGLTSEVYAASAGRVSVGPSGALWARVRENFGAAADPFVDEHRQARGALWLRAMSAHGLRTDPVAVERFATWVSKKHAEVTARLVVSGLVRVEWHLDKAALGKWIADRCAEIGCSALGTKKAELQKLALLMGLTDPNAEMVLCALAWLAIGRVLRAGEPEPQTLEHGEYLLAIARFACLEKAGLARRTYHRDTKAAARAMILACDRAGIVTPRTDSYDPRKHLPSCEWSEFLRNLAVREWREHCEITGGLECVALDKEAVQAVRDGDLDGRLADYAEVSHLGKILSADVPTLRSGTTAPIHTRFEELLETGRTGSSAPNVQNVARGDKDKPGARECYVPREYIYDPETQRLVRAVLVDSDYSLGELHTLAQSCLWTFGWSKLADVLRSGKDPHTVVACRILGISYEDGVKLKKIKDAIFDNARNSGKAVNFGKPGGLSAKTMRAYAVRSYGVDLPEEKWVEILALWDEEWQEMPLYFKWIDSMRGKRGRPVVDKAGHRKIEQLYNLVQPWSGRLRAGSTFCSTCNSVYQGLLADVAKRAGWYLFKACYLPGSVLYGCRPVNFIHDQFLVEAFEDKGDECARTVAGLMNQAGEEILPDVPVRCEPILARRWSKRAEELRGVDGRLVPWEDVRLAVAQIEVADEVE